MMVIDKNDNIIYELRVNYEFGEYYLGNHYKNINEYELMKKYYLMEVNMNDHDIMYRTVFETKTWYQILNLSFYYYDYTNIKHLFNTKYSHIDNLTEQIYHKLRLKHNKLPKYPLEYYRLFNINSYNDIIQNFY